MAGCDRGTKGRLVLGWAIAVVLISGDEGAIAQMIPDATLETQVNGVCNGSGGSCNITDGATRGSNLFHSFLQFSLPNGDTTNFQTLPAIQNVIVRVTGQGTGFVSNINGTISTSNPANFFLLNPNGIIFGPGATLNIGGSFLATTAERMLFQDGTVFNTRDPSPLLTVRVPIGLQTGQTPGNIHLQGTRLAAGSTDNFSGIALVGGNVSLDNANISTSGQGVFLGGLAASGTIELNSSGNSFNLAFPTGVARANVSLTNQSDVEAIAGSGINVVAQDVTLLNGSYLLTGTGQTANSSFANVARDLQVDATGAVQLLDASYIGSALTGGNGSSGKITISGQRVDLINGSAVLSTSVGQGNAGDVTVNANDIISIKGKDTNGISSGIGSYVASVLSLLGVGNGGNVLLQAKDISLEDGALILTSNVSSPGNSGNILIQAGNNLSLTDGSQLRSSTSGQGNAGDITIQAKGAVSLIGTNTAINSSVQDQTAIGNAGNLSITADSITVQAGAQVSSYTVGQGNSGNIFIHVNDLIEVVGQDNERSFITAEVSPGATGRGGNVTIFWMEAPCLWVTTVTGLLEISK